MLVHGNVWTNSDPIDHDDTHNDHHCNTDDTYAVDHHYYYYSYDNNNDIFNTTHIDRTPTSGDVFDHHYYNYNIAMKTVSEILSAQQGPYKWGQRDCLTTAKAIMAEYLGPESVPEEYDRWQAVSEAEALAKAKLEFGGVASAHEKFLSGVQGIEIITLREGEVLTGTHRQPGDIVGLIGKIEVYSGNWNTEEKGDIIGFVGDCHNIFVWSTIGLLEASGDFSISVIFRCRK